jgi:hypothetical protein
MFDATPTKKRGMRLITPKPTHKNIYKIIHIILYAYVTPICAGLWCIGWDGTLIYNL